MEYEVVSPLARRSQSERTTRAIDGAGPAKRIAFVWHYGYRGDEMFAEISEAYGGVIEGTEVFGHEIFGNIHGAAERQVVAELPAKLEELEIDAVVVGVGA